jgi:glutamate synthase (NADPH/NADH) large chain
VRGNVNWMNARRRTMESELLGPISTRCGRSSRMASPTPPASTMRSNCWSRRLWLAHAMMMLMPEAWAGNPLMDAKRRAFYEYHAALMEPWDGPAAVAFTDGRQIGATLDRNGLRPPASRHRDDVVMASESGVLPIPREDRAQVAQPGRMLLIDLEQGRIVEDEEMKASLAGRAL